MRSLYIVPAMLFVSLVLLPRLSMAATQRSSGSGTLFPFQSEKKWGYMNKQGKIIIAPNFDMADRFHEGRAAVKVGQKYGFIDEAGQFCMRPRFDAVGQFHDGCAWVGIGGTDFSSFTAGDDDELQYPYWPDSPVYWHARQLRNLKASGYINLSGKLVVPMGMFICTADFHDGIAAVQKTSNHAYVLINKTGHVILSQAGNKPFHWLGNLSEGLIAATVETSRGIMRAGFIDKTGTFIVKPLFKAAWDFREGFAAVEFNDKSTIRKYGFINRGGKVITVDPLIDRLADYTGFHEGAALVFTLPKETTMFGPDQTDVQYLYFHCSFIDTHGKKIECIAEKPFSEGLAVSRIGYNNYKGSFLKSISSGQISVAGDMFGYVNRSGKFIVLPEYTEALQFQDGVAYVALPVNPQPARGEPIRAWHVIDRQGKELKP